MSTADSAGIALVTIVGEADHLPEWRLSAAPVAEVSGHAEPYLGRVGEVALLSTGELLVEDDQTAELHRFDSSGSHVAALAGRGDGPGEFRNLAKLTVTSGDTVWAYDRRHYRLSAFDPDEGLAHEITIGRELAGPATLAFEAWTIDSDHLVVYSIGPGDNTRPSGAARRDQRDAILHSLDGGARPRVPPLSFVGGYSIVGDLGSATTLFANRPIVSVAAERVLHGSGLTYELTLSTDSLEPTTIVRWEGWVQPLTESLLQAARDTFEVGLAPLRESRPDLAAALADGLFSPDVLPQELPALRSALLDDQGRIWVSRFRLLADPWNEEDAWHVLDPAGTPLARLPLPPNSRLVAVRNDRVVLVMRDDLEVEHVRVFGLEALEGPR